jgi:tetratricopeptide (TPR) repeat protein
LLVKNEAALGIGNVEEARAALDSIQDKDDMDYQAARLWLYLMERDYSGAITFGAKATDEVKRTPSFWLILAMAAHAQGNLEEARRANAEAKLANTSVAASAAGQPRSRQELAFAEAALGQRKRPCGMQATQRIYCRRAWMHWQVPCENRLAQVLAVTGDRDGAFEN